MASSSSAARSTATGTTAAGPATAVGTAAPSTGPATAVGTATSSAGSTTGVETAATAKSLAAVCAVVTVPVDTAEPRLNTADVVVEHCAFRIALAARGVVLTQHETL